MQGVRGDSSLCQIQGVPGMLQASWEAMAGGKRRSPPDSIPRAPATLESGREARGMVAMGSREPRQVSRTTPRGGHAEVAAGATRDQRDYLRRELGPLVAQKGNARWQRRNLMCERSRACRTCSPMGPWPFAACGSATSHGHEPRSQRSTAATACFGRNTSSTSKQPRARNDAHAQGGPAYRGRKLPTGVAP